jgi:hypothetical protein
LYCALLLDPHLSTHVNRKLKNEVDVLEQYGRRSLIRISGIPEPTEQRDTTEKVRKIISDIDPSYEITNIIVD